MTLGSPEELSTLDRDLPFSSLGIVMRGVEGGIFFQKKERKVKHKDDTCRNDHKFTVKIWPWPAK